MVDIGVSIQDQQVSSNQWSAHNIINLHNLKNPRNLYTYLDCCPSGKFGEGRIVPPDVQATINLASLSTFDSTTVQIISWVPIHSFIDVITA